MTLLPGGRCRLGRCGGSCRPRKSMPGDIAGRSRTFVAVVGHNRGLSPDRSFAASAGTLAAKFLGLVVETWPVARDSAAKADPSHDRLFRVCSKIAAARSSA